MGRPILSPLYIQIHQLVITTLFQATLHIFRISFLVTKLVCFDFGYIKFEMLRYGLGGKNGPAYSFPTMNTNL